MTIDGREGRVSGKDVSAVYGTRRNGMPGPRLYTYRGTGRDELTGHKTPARIIAETAAFEGAAYRPPLYASDVWKQGEVAPQDPDTGRRRGPEPGPRCDKPLTGNNRSGDYCGRPKGHDGKCKSRAAADRDRWARPAAKENA